LPRPKGAKGNILPGPRVPIAVESFVCCISASNYQVAALLSATTGYEFATRAILDTGSGPKLIRADLLPKGLTLSPPGVLAKGLFHDVNGGLLPIIGCVTLWVQSGDQRTPVCFGVVRSMSTPVILGNSYTDQAVRSIDVEHQTVRLMSGGVIPIIRGSAHVQKRSSNRDAVCACPQGGSAPLRVQRKTRVPAD